MLGHFNHLLMASATDGASAAIDVSGGRAADDVDQLMEAWYRERQERIETGLFLEQARDLLVRMLAEGRITSLSRRRARRLLSAIKASGHGSTR